MLFNYKLVDNKHKIKEGQIEANTIKEARNRLTLQEGAIISLTAVETNQTTKGSKAKSRGLVIGRVKLIDKIMFAKHLSVMIKSGMGMDDALEVLASNASPVMGKILDDVLEEVRKGNSLSSAFQKHHRDFDPLFINMIAVGESGGTLAKNLEILSIQQHKIYDLKNKIKAASLYPIIIFLAIIGLIVVVSIFVLPKITSFFSTLQVELPLATRILMTVAEFFATNWAKVIIVLISLFILLRVMLRLKSTRLFLHHLILKLPIVGKISHHMNLALFARTLGSLLNSGITIDKALQIVSKTLTNDVYQREVIIIYHKVVKGSSLADSLSNKQYFPLIVSRMSRVGERSGNLSEVLEYLADFYEIEVDNTTKNLSTILEPALLVFIGLVVGFVAISIISPIYDLTSKVGR